MPLSPLRLDSPLRQAERTFRRPSTAVWLRAVTVRTVRFDDALAFYVNAIGLTLGGLDVHPLTGETRAHLLDGEGAPVLHLVETDGTVVAGHELAFGMPRRTLLLLQARLKNLGIVYTQAGDSLFVSDVDGTLLRVEAL